MRTAVAVSLTVVVLLAAGAARGDPAASVEFQPDQIFFSPRVAGEALTLTVSCVDGTHFEERFAGSRAVAFTLDQKLRPIADGPCKYQLAIHPELDHDAIAAADATGFPSQSFLIQILDGSNDYTPVVIENGAGSQHNLLYLDATERIGINTTRRPGRHRRDDPVRQAARGGRRADRRRRHPDVQPRSQARARGGAPRADSRRRPALPLYRWKFRHDPLQSEHLGPVAEDVWQRFALGRDERHLSPADTAGPALAAIQALNERLAARIDELERVNHELARRLAALELGGVGR